MMCPQDIAARSCGEVFINSHHLDAYGHRRLRLRGRCRLPAEAVDAPRHRDETLTELASSSAFDDDLAGEVIRISNRTRSLLTGIHPAHERALGPRITHPAILEWIPH